MDFIHDDFLLHSKAARTLYHDYAEPEPILDYHSHLPAAEIVANRKFQNLFEIWLQGDHYKWRAMRANGIAERYCTGDAEPHDLDGRAARCTSATRHRGSQPDRDRSPPAMTPRRSDGGRIAHRQRGTAACRARLCGDRSAVPPISAHRL